MKPQMKLFLTAALLLTGCAHAAVEERLNAKLGAEPAIESRADLNKEAEDILASDKSITDAQKTEMRALWEKTREKMGSFQEQSLKLRSLLVKDVVAGGAGNSEIDLIKNRLSDIEHRRLAEYFRAVSETNRILGRWGSEAARERYYEMIDFSSRYLREDGS